MKNTIGAALPLIIALAGGGLIPSSDTTFATRFRVAETYSISTPLLTEDQQAWMEEHNPFGLPLSDEHGHNTLIVRQGYTLSHDDVDLIADWVSFHLTKDYVNGTEARPGSSAFKPDPLLPKARRAELSDYSGWKGIFDRGHQVASADSKGRGKPIIRESFFLSNMTPQSSRLNQGKWRLLEKRIQDLAAAKGELWVVTGPVFLDDDGDGLVEYTVIGRDEVAVPTHYFKIVLAASGEPQPTGPEYEAMALLVPNHAFDDDFDEFLVSIDRVEEVTGFDFFPQMEDAEEDRLEAATSDRVW